MLIKDMKTEIETMPYYLTKRNKSFQQMIHDVRSKIRTTFSINNNVDEVRKISILIYKIMIIQTYHRLWTTYLKSGLGQLISAIDAPSLYSTTLPIWPKTIKDLLQLNNNTNANDIYFNFVNQKLHELNHQLKQYQTELNRQANNFHIYTLTIQKVIETYIEKHLQTFRMNIEHQIDLIYYDYHIRALKSEYFRSNPNEYQVGFFIESIFCFNLTSI